MRRFVVTGLLMVIYFFGVQAQKPFLLVDTVHIEEVVSYGNLNKYQSGAKIENIAESQFKYAQDGSLEQLILKTLPVSFKADAGGLSTIRIRGTAPDHTSLNFGGININSLTLGHSNVSNIPLFLFDEVGIQFGSSSSVNGSGSIGGAIHLGIKNNWVNGFKSEIRVANGSFGEQLYGTKMFWGNGRFEVVTRAYYYAKTNDFKFLNPNYRDFENGIFEVKDRQHNAGIKKWGLLQEFNYKFSVKQVFLLKAWIENDGYQIQHNMQTNLYQPGLKETYSDNNIRIWADFKNETNPLKFQLSGGYVNDKAIFNGNTADSIQTRRWIGEGFIEQDFLSNLSYRAGAKAIRIYPEVYAYSSTFDFEDRVDFYASLFYRFFGKLTTTFNLRQGFVTNFNVPFTPAFGLNYLALSKEKYILNFTGNVARSYRVPTFNDRFWIPGGNPRLEPEKGMNYELGTKWSYCDTNISGNIKVNAFYMSVKDWILWKNGGNFWYAENVQNVESKGLEWMSDVKYKVGKVEFTSGLNYSFTSAKRVKSENLTSALNRQLEYVPKHSGNIFTTAGYKNFDFTLNGRFTGNQFTDEEDKNMLDANFLLNFAAGYNLTLNHQNRVQFYGLINNVLNTNYQSDWNYAMPGINYRLSIIYHFNEE